MQSECNKTDNISNYIEENECDIVFLSETWIPKDNDFTCNQLTPNGYAIHHVSRVGKLGGGVGIVTRNVLRAKPIEVERYASFEHAVARMKWQDMYLTAVVYRPPGHNKEFLSEFANLLEPYTLKNDRLLICGDFNIHVDNKLDSSVTNFLEILSNFGLVQNIREPTHRSGHTLDLVITRSDDDLFSGMPKTSELFSVHLAIKFQYTTQAIIDERHTILFRKLKQLDINRFKEEISDLNQKFSSQNIDSLVDTYNTTMQTAIDKLAPVCQKCVKNQTLKPWIDEVVFEARKQRRKLERNMLKTMKNIEAVL